MSKKVRGRVIGGMVESGGGDTRQCSTMLTLNGAAIAGDGRRSPGFGSTYRAPELMVEMAKSHVFRY
ncbi:hypothetical protein HanRHA438_Chr01g0026881 [Helianthus annuus]|uniref:Uncharacterized protein n=1 Tax=Helianthus annuus TaxID=4232 RepID=A0A9K3P389_HELAN|nr:hypothetical protein HanXRQr2_Chr01g0026511 [Helianthus annuus]KAJ0623155.1 hypothetical protein HanIR_Chr01g0028641 [Helianthus annuus]KAJ0948411.1 hypothetical protein HanRHA438_Chr01g0026881 [Helianthus annuus]KAJ0957301.1 hypothetical protein HanPSC8_Chr01g0025611 [Helianthus annuus]